MASATTRPSLCFHTSTSPSKPSNSKPKPHLKFTQTHLKTHLLSRRLAGRFAVECRSCGYKYDESAGDPSYPILPGFQFEKLPEDWRCPTCGAAKSFFERKRVKIAWIAENQQFGFGDNALAVVVFGGYLLHIVFILSGYFLQ